MWIMLPDSFLSIVSKDCPRDSLLVRARRKGDIEKIFPKAAVKRSTTTDYLYRAVVSRAEIEFAVVGEVRRITYANFKSAVDDPPLHDAYLRVWNAMSELQTPRPFGARDFKLSAEEDAHLFATGHMPDEEFDPPPKPRRKKARSLKKGR